MCEAWFATTAEPEELSLFADFREALERRGYVVLPREALVMDAQAADLLDALAHRNVHSTGDLLRFESALRDKATR